MIQNLKKSQGRLMYRAIGLLKIIERRWFAWTLPRNHLLQLIEATASKWAPLRGNHHRRNSDQVIFR